jgi:ribosome-associated toxin RatA of RatAB toxin-antitoxin module
MINDKNVTDIFLRNAIAGLLDFLNRNIEIPQIVNGVLEMHPVKFYYNFGQDEQFMKDFFVQLDHGCLLHRNPEGNFDVRPVGVTKFNGFTIRPGEITNRFVRATTIKQGYTANMEKQLKAYSSYLMRLPMTMRMSVEIQADGLSQGMRVMEAVLSTIYKSNVIYFNYKGIRVPMEALMGDNEELEKKTEFTYDDDQKAVVKFELEMNTTFPVFDDASTLFKANRIKEFKLGFEKSRNIQPTLDGYSGTDTEHHNVNEFTHVEGMEHRRYPVPTVIPPREDKLIPGVTYRVRTQEVPGKIRYNGEDIVLNSDNYYSATFTAVPGVFSYSVPEDGGEPTVTYEYEGIDPGIPYRLDQ